MNARTVLKTLIPITKYSDNKQMLLAMLIRQLSATYIPDYTIIFNSLTSFRAASSQHRCVYTCVEKTAMQYNFHKYNFLHSRTVCVKVYSTHDLQSVFCIYIMLYTTDHVNMINITNFKQQSRIMEWCHATQCQYINGIDSTV